MTRAQLVEQIKKKQSFLCVGLDVDLEKALQKTIEYLNTNYPEVFTIADAKRGDIGNTSTRYAKAFFEDLAFDSITVAPYMGSDSIEPFLAFENKFTIMLALTSNVGGLDFQTLKIENIALYKKVLQQSLTWKNSDNLMYVVGATRPEYFKEIRLSEVCKYGLNKDIGLLVNSTRGIIYASNQEDFAKKAQEKALELQQEMKAFIN